jgi:hypothetical protein
MGKQSEVLTSRIALGVLLLVVGAGFVLTLILLIFSSAYTYVALGPTLLLGGGFSLYAGIKQLRATTREGTSLAWWKHYLIIIALFQGCLGGLLLAVSKPVRDQVNSAVISSIGLVFLLLTLGFGLYGIILTVQHNLTNTSERKSL